MSQITVTALILSAGLSQRMDGRLKPLIYYKGTPFLVHIIKKVSAVCNNIIIVTGYKAGYVQDEIKKWLIKNNRNLIKNIHWCHNTDYEQGMLLSLQTGLSFIKKTDWILYHFTDQPTLPDKFYEEFIEQIHTAYDWIQPQYKGQSGHPVLFSQRLVEQILALESNQSLRDISNDQKLNHKVWNCNFPEILTDYDTPEQLKELKE